MATDVTIWLAFGAGLLSFLSPCVFPLYPAFLSYITGLTVTDIQQGNMRGKKQAIFHTLSFLLGFSIIYLVLGLSASSLTGFFYQYNDLVRQAGAILIVVFGFITLGFWQPKFLMKDHKLTIQNRPTGYVGSVVIGLAFAAGWTPCMGPILGAVLALVGSNPETGMFYMVAYILGFAIPFLTLAFFSTRLQWVKKYSGTIMKAGGIIMVVVGILLFFDQMTIFNRLLSPIFGNFQGF